MKKRDVIIFWLSTTLLSLLLLFSVFMYITNTQGVGEEFIKIGYNARIVIPLAFAKLLAIVAITTRKSHTLAQWAYFGLFINFLLALEGHLSANDGDQGGAIVALALLIISYLYSKKV